MLFGTRNKIELKVSGMTCGHCEAKVQEAVKSVTGVKNVWASVVDGKVTIVPEKSGSVDFEQLKEVIISLGYHVLE